MNDRLNKNLLGKIPPGVFGEMRFSERATRTERNPRQRRSPPAEGRPRAIHNPPTRHPHPRVSDTSRIVDGGNPRKNTIPRSRVPITWQLRSRTLPSALSSDIGCHNCCWTPVPSQPSPVRPGGTLPRAREPRARIQPPHPRLTPNLLRKDSAPTPRLEQKVWRGNDYHPGPPKPVQTVADEVSAEHPPSAVDKQVFNALSNTQCRAMTCTGGRPETDGQEQNSTGCMDDPVDVFTHRDNWWTPGRMADAFDVWPEIISRGIAGTPSNVTDVCTDDIAKASVLCIRMHKHGRPICSPVWLGNHEWQTLR